MHLSFPHPLKSGILACVLAACSGMASAACGSDTTISPTSDYSLTFRVCDSSLVGSITAMATGWVAVGFSTDPYMPETDVFMAGVRGDGTAYGSDRFAQFRSPPIEDTRQDVTLLGASELNGATTVTFSRPLNTGDASDFDLTKGSYYILMAFNATSDSLTMQHSYRDASEVAYMFAPVPEPQTPLMLLAGLGLLAVVCRGRVQLKR